MLLAGILCARPASVTAYSAKLPAAELIARSPGLKSLTSLPTASTSPAHSRPTMVPVPPTVPCRWRDATARSARLSEAARTLIRISCGLGTGLATSRIETPFSPTTAAFMTSSSSSERGPPGPLMTADLEVRAPFLYDLALATRPVTVAQQALVELAGGMARQLGFKVDAARAFEGGEVLAALGYKLLGKVGTGVGHVARLHDGLHLLAEIGVGHTEHRAIHHLGMVDQKVLAFLRVDVDPARDDHERLAVGQVQEAVAIDVAHFAKGRPTLRVARSDGPLRIV